MQRRCCQLSQASHCKACSLGFTSWSHIEHRNTMMNVQIDYYGTGVHFLVLFISKRRYYKELPIKLAFSLHFSKNTSTTFNLACFQLGYLLYRFHVLRLCDCINYWKMHIKVLIIKYNHEMSLIQGVEPIWLEKGLLNMNVQLLYLNLK